MTITDGQSGIRALTLEQLHVSTTGSQAERRKHFDKAALTELAESIKTIGLLSPIIARPAARIDVVESTGGGRWYPAHKRAQIEGHNLIGGGYTSREAAEAEADKLRSKQGYEVVAGERRLIAAKTAGLIAISVDVRTLTDEQVLEIQLVENLQREGLHELAEAEGYEALQGFGHSAEEIAAKVGKSKAYVYGRLKLLALDPASRQSFYRGEINASIALLLARIPVASVQREAVGKITKGRYDGGPMSFREARDYIEREYMLRLGDAAFPTGNADLLPKAGACGPCPKRTGNQAELFADIKSADVCSDPVCFKLKREAWSKLQIDQAKEAGRKVIAGAQAKEIAPYGDQSFAQGYTRLDAKCWEDPKQRTYKQILGKEAKPVLVQLPKGGDLIELVQKSDAVKKLKADGVIEPRESTGGSGQVKRRNPAEEAAEQAFHGLLFSAIHAKAPRKLTRNVLERLVEHQMDVVCGDLPQMFFTAWGWDADNYSFDKLTEPQLHQLLFEILLVDEFSADTAIQTEQLTKVAKSLGVDVKRVRADAAKLAGAPAAKPAKKAKGKKK